VAIAAKWWDIRSASGVMPVISRNASTAWNTAMPPPSSVRHGRASAAGADLDNPVSLDVGQATAEAFGEARGIGIMADPSAVA
jgi:hypothetical protein